MWQKTKRIAVVAALFGVCISVADLTVEPDTDTLWLEDFSPLETAADSRSGWFAFEPPEISAEQLGDCVRLREVSKARGGSIQRILPLGGNDFRYLQIRVVGIENPDHFFMTWARLPTEGNPRLGRMATGINTVDLGQFSFLEKLQELPLDLAVIGPDGNTPSGAVDLDWIRLVKRPTGGLTVQLVDDGEPNGVAEIGDTIRFVYTPDQPVGGPLDIVLRLAKDGQVIRISNAEQTQLEGDDVLTADVKISPEAPELSVSAGAVIASVTVNDEPRNTTALFPFAILPAPWQARKVAESITIGEEIVNEDFSGSSVANWRQYSDGWAVNRSETENGRTAALENYTYNAPRPDGHWIALPSPPLDDMTLAAGLRPLGGAGPMMLAVRFSDPDNHYRMRITGGTRITIERVCAGWVESLASTVLPESIRRAADEPAARVSFAVVGSTLLARVDGMPVLHAYDTTFAQGKGALGLNRSNGQFDRVVLNAAAPSASAPALEEGNVRLSLELDERKRAIGRDEDQMRIPTEVVNTGNSALGPFRLTAHLVRDSLYNDPVLDVEVPVVDPGKTAKVTLGLDPIKCRAGTYIVVARLRAGEDVVATDAVRIVIGPPVPSERMDVFWWGGTSVASDLAAVADAGITVLHEQAQRTAELREVGCTLGLEFYSHPPSLRGKAPATLQEGFENPHASSRAIRLDENDEEVRTWALKAARTHARRWRSDARTKYVLLNTEYEGHSYPNLSEAAEARYREMLGFPRPDDAIAPYMVPSRSLELFPDRVIPDDAPLYRWFRFFYTRGGALNGLTCAQSTAIRDLAPHIITLHDPVLRAPQFYGRWDGLAMLNHWTYVERNPLDVVAFADELVCLAKHSNWTRKISQMIQVIAYAKSAMPGNRDNAPDYLKDAPFVAIPPDILTEAVWLVMSRPVDMIAFHGLQTAIETQEQDGYRYTNPHTLAALGRVTEALVEPYGPALRRIKERNGPRVALLLSGANTVFGRIMEGGGTRSLHNPLTAARFGVDVIYDDDVGKGVLDEYNVLAIPQCRFMLKSVRDRVTQFQEAGGVVLLDSEAGIKIAGAMVLPQVSAETAGEKHLELVPGEVIDVRDSSRARMDADLRRTAEALRADLLPRLEQQPFVDSPHPYVVLDARRSGDLSYIFVINDRRETGPYLGQFGAVLERGVPITADVLLRERPGALYDALARHELTMKAGDDGAGTVSVQIAPGWGKLLVAAPEAMGSAKVTVAGRPATGGSIDIRAQVRYASGRAVKGVVPLRVEVQSPDGALCDYSRFTATAADGSWSSSIPVADNEPPGGWVARVTELIGGHTTVARFAVETGPTGTASRAPVDSFRPIARWQFDGDEPTRESLGTKMKMTLRGRSRFITDDGSRGGVLECFASEEGSAEGVEITHRGTLSPPGAFSAELWLKPKPELANAKLTMLLDCNYYLQARDIPKAHTGYAFYLSRERDGLRPRIVLGVGDQTLNYPGRPVELKPGTWYRLGFVYDGKGGVKILLDGRVVGSGRRDAGAIARSKHPLVIGGRVGSSHFGCSGFIDDVRLASEQ